MKVGFGLEIADYLLHAQSALHEVEINLRKWFATRTYGAGVEEVVIGLTIVSKRDYKNFPLRKPKYYRGQNKIVKEGFSMDLDNLLEIYVRPEIERIENWSTKEVSSALASALVDSEAALQQLGIKDFDVVGFNRDLHRALLSG